MSLEPACPEYFGIRQTGRENVSFYLNLHIHFSKFWFTGHNENPSPQDSLLKTHKIWTKNLIVL